MAGALGVVITTDVPMGGQRAQPVYVDDSLPIVGPSQAIVVTTGEVPQMGGPALAVRIAPAGTPAIGPALPVYVVSGSLGGNSMPVSPPANTGLPVISGTANIGQLLSTTDGTWTNSPTSYTYQWERSGVDIGGATANTYTTVLADAGQTITVTVTASNAGGSASATSAGLPIFSPSQLSGLVLWLQADSLALNDNDPVSTWTDSSGSGNNATQGTATNQPLYKTNVINGRPVVRFDGVDNFLNVPAIDLTGTAAATLFAVVANITSGGDRVIYENSTNINSFTDGFLLFRDASNKAVAALRGSAGGAGSNFISTATVIATAAVISAVYDKSLATNEVTNWIDGTSAGTRPQNLNNTNNFGNRASFIGMRAGTSLPLAGDIAEILVYNRALNTTERQQVEAYLS